MVERFNENSELDYSELEVFVPELEDLHGEVERGMGPEEVRNLTEEEFNVLVGKDILTKDEMKAVVKYANENDYRELYLGIRSIDVETTTELVQSESNLHLNGLTSLDAETARALAKFYGYALSLDGLTSLDAETARALSELQGESLHLNGLTSLDVETARALSEFKGGLSLDGLTSLDVETARALVEFKGEFIGLYGIENISDEVAGILIPIKSKISGSYLIDKIDGIERKIMDGGLNGLQRKIENIKKKKDWKEERGNIEYKMEEREISSWGNTVKVERRSKDTIKLKGYGLILTLEEGMWLANFKNRFKHTYPGQKVEFKKDKLNKKLAIRKTLCVGNTMLMSRHDLVEHLPYLERDGLMEALVKWLNS